MEKKFKCNICDTSYGLKASRDSHVARVHEGKKPYQCNKCESKWFCSKGELNRHVVRVHEKEKPFKCVKCDSKFKEKGDLDRHIRTVHAKEKILADLSVTW